MVFPDRFLWGVSSSAFQFEMGDPSHTPLDRNTDWFVWVHDKHNIERKVVSGDFPEDGPDYWFLYKEDHKLSSDLGLNACRLSVEWSRVFPKSTRGVKVDVERTDDGRISRIGAEEARLGEIGNVADNNALNHYRSMVVDLRERGIKPYVCLNHVTLPLWIHDPIVAMGFKLKSGSRGWFDEDTIVEFWKYAAYVAWKLGDLVDCWATLSEPVFVSESGYLFPEMGFPPGLKSFSAFKRVFCNMVVAHARAYDAIKEWDKVKTEHDGSSPAEIGLIQAVSPMVPYDPDHHREVSNYASHIHNTCFVEAVSGGWLDENLDGIRQKHEVKNYLRNRLDWIGVNYYSRNVMRGGKSILGRLFAGVPFLPEMVTGYGNSCKPRSTSADGRPTSDSGWEVYPEGLTEALRIMSKYEKPMLVTENGIADAEDNLRPQFITDHLRELEQVLSEKKLDVRGYFHWALTDNYEWASGFRMKFGLYSVDFKTKARVPRKSAETYKKIILIKEVP